MMDITVAVVQFTFLAFWLWLGNADNDDERGYGHCYGHCCGD